MYQSKFQIVTLILLATSFGLASGVVGSIIARVYVIEKEFNVPLVGEIDTSESGIRGSSLIIKNPRKVVVEQDTKIEEVVKSSKESIVGIYNFENFLSLGKDKPEKNIQTTSATTSDVISFLHLSDEESQGFIVTSDGWIMSNFAPDVLLNAKQKEVLEKLLKNYYIVDKNKEIFNVTDFVYDKNSNFSFWKIDAKELPVKKFVSSQNINNGQLVIAIDWNQKVLIDSIQNIIGSNNSIIEFSDNYDSQIELNEDTFNVFEGDFYVFNLDGDFLALMNKKKEIKPAYLYERIFNNLLKGEDYQKSSLGIYYINLGKVVFEKSNSDYKKGALIYKNKEGISIIKNSPAEKSGLKEGDIILSVNNFEVSEDLGLDEIISKFSSEEKVNIVYLRNEELASVDVILGEL